jgi:hypothetical protein
MPTLTKDQQQIFGRNTSAPLSVYGNNWVASNFTPSVSGNLNKIYTVIHKVGSPVGPLTVGIYATSSGKPTGAALATQSILDTSITDYGLLTVTFSSPAALTASTKYAIVLSNGGGNSSNYYKPYWSGSGEDFYGSSITDYTSTDGGSTWSNQSTSDLMFITEMSTVTATPGIDQFCFCDNGYGEFITSNTTQIAQTFIPSVSAQLKQLKVHLNRVDGQVAGSVTFAIKAVDGANKPTGADLASQSVADTSIGSGLGTSALTVTFSSPASLTNGTTYAIVVRFPNAAGGARYSLAAWIQSDLEASIRAWKSSDSGSTWGNGAYGAGEDIGFITYMYEITTTTQTINSNAIVQATATQTINSNAIVFTTSEQTLDSDATILTTSTPTINSNTTVQVTSEKNILSDAFCGQETLETITSDARVGASVVQTILSDAFCGEETLQAVLSDATIRAYFIQTILSSAHVLITSLQNVYSDAVVYISNSQTIPSDAMIQSSFSQTIVSDANVILANAQSIFSDAHVLVIPLRTIYSNTTVALTTIQMITSNAIVVINEPVLEMYIMV